MVTIGLANDRDLKQILNLQSSNLKRNLDPGVYSKEGYVTLEHDLELLKKMNKPYPHIVAKEGSQLVGYALVMLPTLKKEIPLLYSMFSKLEALKYKQKKLSESTYFVMGQICIDKSYRRKGIFADLYGFLEASMKDDFEFILTEVATLNLRSINAHKKYGFECAMQFIDDTEEWEILIKRI